MNPNLIGLWHHHNYSWYTKLNLDTTKALVYTKKNQKRGLEVLESRLEKRDVMQNLWRDIICRFEWTRPLISALNTCPQYLPMILAPDSCPRYLGSIKDLLHSIRQIMFPQKFRLTSLFGTIKEHPNLALYKFSGPFHKKPKKGDKIYLNMEWNWLQTLCFANSP